MFVGHKYYEQQEESKAPTAFDKMSLKNFSEFVGKASKSNADRQNDAIATADFGSFLRVHPEVLGTNNNMRIINHWLTTQNITSATYPDFEAAYEAYKDSGLLDIDAAELARDHSTGRTYTGVFTKQQFTSLDELVASERRAAITQLAPISDIERDFDNLPPEQAQNLIREAERAEQQQANAAAIQDAADAWLVLHPEWRDDTKNGKHMRAQLRINGVNQPAPRDFEHAAQQLRASGLVALNPKQVEKQHAKAIQQQATEAAREICDETNEQEAWELPLEELKRRANGNFSGVGV